MINWARGSLTRDVCERTARARLERVVSERRLVPLRCGLRHDLIGTAFEERLIDNGLAEGRLKEGHPELIARGFFNGHRLQDGCLIGAVRSGKEQEGPEDDRAHDDTHK